MSYSVIRMQKIKAGGVRGIQNHDQRLKDSLTNPDIDQEKTELNEDIHGEDQRTYYMRIKDRISELNLPKAPRKDAVVMCEFITTSDKAYFDGLPPKEQKRFFKESYDFIAERYGKENIVHATVHYDEKTPHLHMGIVPVTKDNRLSCYNIFDKKELMSLQQDFNRHMNSKGFDLEKGESREDKRKHLDTQRFKAETIKEQVNDLSKEANALRSEINAFESDLKKVEDIKARFDQVNAIEGKSTLLSKKKVVVEAKTLEHLKDIGKRQHVLESKIESLENENTYLKKRTNRSVKQQLERASKEKDLVKENERLKNGLQHLSKFLAERGLKDKANEYIREQTSIQKTKGKTFDLER